MTLHRKEAGAWYYDRYGHKHFAEGVTLPLQLHKGVVIEFIDDRCVEDLPFEVAADILAYSEERRVCSYEYEEVDPASW